MIIWIDAHISPSVAKWIQDEFKIESYSFYSLGLLRKRDVEIYKEAQIKGEVIIISKDIDFVHLINKSGAPPYLLWLTCGNTSSAELRKILFPILPKCMRLFNEGEKIIEVR